MVPSIGLAILGAWALTAARGSAAVLAAVFALLYCTLSIGHGYSTEKYFYNRARPMKYIVQGLQVLPQAQAGSAILIDGVDNDLFWSGISDDPFRLMGISRVYLTPGSETFIDPHPEWGGISRFVISLDQAIPMLQNHQAVVLKLNGRELTDATARFLARVHFAADHPEFVDVGDPLYGSRLGPTWYQIEGDYQMDAENRHRANRRSFQVRPDSGSHGLLSRRCSGPRPARSFLPGDGIEIGSAVLNRPDQHFDLKLPLPAALVGRPDIEVAIEVSRTTRMPPATTRAISA